MDKNYEDFFIHAKKTIEKIELKKLRGINDYNIFTTLLNYHDEVRVHSRFLHSLLDIHGKHYQKELFLRKFIEVCGLGSFGLDIKNTKAYKEYNYIDLYLTDGEYHIIIENKIYAGEQERQVQRYIQSIMKENNNISEDKIYVIYLSKNIKYPSKYSLGDFTLDKNKAKLKRGDFEIAFKSIHYNKEIKYWINECLKEVSNLTNLQVILNQYKNTIDLLYDKYKGVEVDFEKLIKENYDISIQICENIQFARQNIIDDFLQKVALNLQNKLPDYQVNITKTKFERWIIPLSIVPKLDNKKTYLYFVLEILHSNLTVPYMGFKVSDGKLDCDKIKNRFDIKDSMSERFLCWKYVDIGNENIDDLAKYIQNGSLSVEVFSKIIIDIINTYQKIVFEINQNIKDYLK